MIAQKHLKSSRAGGGDHLQKKRGQALITITVSLMTLSGVMGLIADLGWSHFVKRSAKTAADSAAMAAAEAALEAVGQANAFACGGTVGCADSISCANASKNIQNGCQLAQQNGFAAGGKGGRQNVTMAANISSPPPGAPERPVIYWTAARVTERTPQLLSAILGSKWGTTTAHATAAVFESSIPASVYLLNRRDDVPGNVSIAGGETQIHGNGGAAPILQDPMQGKGQPPAPSQAQAPAHPVAGGKISGKCSHPKVLSPGTYYATDAHGAPTGAAIALSGCVTFGSGSSHFANYVFIGGASFEGAHSVFTYSPGRYIFAGHHGGGSVYSQSNGVTVTDKTTADGNGNSADNADAGEILIFSGTDYPGLWIPDAITNSGISFQHGSADFHTGNHPISRVNLHGLNRNSADLPEELRTFAPVVLWQDQANSAIRYDANGYVDTTSCGSGHNLDSPCRRTDGSVLNPSIHLQANPKFKLNGVIYQPRGSKLTIQGHGAIDGPIQVITGSIEMGGGARLNLHSLSNPPTTRIVALVE